LLAINPKSVCGAVEENKDGPPRTMETAIKRRPASGLTLLRYP
jgi:hypothetical protein